jgi:hypothetical protein
MKEYELDKSTGELTWTYEPMSKENMNEYFYSIKNLIVSEINAQHSIPNYRLTMILNICDEALNK